LICYYPFARSAAEWLENYSDENYENKSEWAITSGIINKSGTDYNEFETGIYDTTWSGELLSEISIENDSITPSPEATSPYIVIDDIDLTDVGAITYLDAEAWVRGATSGVSAEGIDSYIAAHDNFIDTSSGENGIYAHTYNPGDLDTDWMLIAPITDFTAAGALGLDNGNGLIGIEAITRQGTDTHLRYNSISGLLEGLEIVDTEAEIPEYRLTNHVYN